MAEPQSVRNERAQRILRELGHDPGPLRGADNRLRKVRGALKGYTPSQAVGKPKVGERFVSRPEVRQPRRRLRTQPSRSLGSRQVIPFGPAGRIVQSTDQRFVARQLREAGRKGERVGVRVTAAGNQGVRTHSLAGTAEQRQRMADRVAAAPTTGGTIAPDSDGVELLTKPQLTFSSSSEVFDQGEGFDPDELLSWLLTYDDFDDAWADMWDWESYYG